MSICFVLYAAVMNVFCSNPKQKNMFKDVIKEATLRKKEAEKAAAAEAKQQK